MIVSRLILEMIPQKALHFLLKVKIVVMEVLLNLLRCGLTTRTWLLLMSTLIGALVLRKVMEMVQWLPYLALVKQTSNGFCTIPVATIFMFGKTLLQRNVSSSLAMEILNLRPVTKILSNSLACTLLDPVDGALLRAHGRVPNVQNQVDFLLQFLNQYHSQAVLLIPLPQVYL